MGLPQDFVEDVLPEVVKRFARQRPNVHLEVRAGRNYSLDEDVHAGKLDLAIAFCRPGTNTYGTRITSLPMLWLAERDFAKRSSNDAIPLVLFDYPCLFRQTALRSLEGKALRWRLALTTPSLPGVWAALRLGHGVSIRTPHCLPSGIADVGPELGLPKLPSLELRMFSGNGSSPAVSTLEEILTDVVRKRVSAKLTGSRR
jgi:DNA-binding transcriptional LysR family regulator